MRTDNLYTEQRDHELLRAFNRAKAKCLHDHGYIILLDAVNDARCSPATRFFVSDIRASVVLRDLDRHFKSIESGLKAGQQGFHPDPLAKISRYQTRRMYSCLYEVYCKMRDENPELTHTELTVLSIEQPAPEFFLTLDSARAILGYIHVNTRRNGKRVSNQRTIYNNKNK